MTIEQRRNGQAHGILRIGDITTERRPVEINGRTYLGFVRGKGCPRSVEATYNAAWSRYRRRMVDAEAAVQRSRYGHFIDLEPLLLDVAANLGVTTEAGYERFLELAPLIKVMAEMPSVEDPVGASLAWTECILAVLPGLEEEYALADSLDHPAVMRILRALEWLPGGEEEAAVAEEDAEGENPLPVSETSETTLPSNAASPRSD